MAKSKKIILTLITLMILLAPVYYASAGAPNLGDAFKKDGPLYKVSDAAGYDTSKTDTNTFFSVIINVALSFVGVIFLLLMIYGGYLWMTARGNEQQVEKAKNLIIAAIIGLVIVLAAYAITYFVLYKLGGTLKWNE